MVLLSGISSLSAASYLSIFHDSNSRPPNRIPLFYIAVLAYGDKVTAFNIAIAKVVPTRGFKDWRTALCLTHHRRLWKNARDVGILVRQQALYFQIYCYIK